MSRGIQVRAASHSPLQITSHKTRVVRGALEAALRAHVEVPTQGGRPADGDRTERVPLLARERLALTHRRPVRPHDRRHVEPARRWGGRTAAGAHRARHDALR